ncbi:MAG: 3-phosphoglycerate dehydrogenase, partial [Oscillospiraceae bacterium]|nr:3-phosphoglycerate dehydrogenase [Oscillospiraceae bacterium]
MYQIKTLNKISPLGLAELDPAKYTIADEVENPDAILLRSFKMHDYDFNPALACIGRAGAGVNNIPLDRSSEAGIVVFNTPGANARAVMELVLCGMLMASRDVPGGMDWLKTVADDPEVAAKVEKGKSQFVGPEIFGKTLGVIGLGAIGYQTANAAAALGMTVVGYDPYLADEFSQKLSPEVQVVANLDDLYSQSDYISLNVPVNDKTRGMVGAEAIAKMKADVRIINMARAELVDDDALLAALAEGKVA